MFTWQGKRVVIIYFQIYLDLSITIGCSVGGVMLVFMAILSICISLNDIDFAINFYTKYHLGNNSNSYLLGCLATTLYLLTSYFLLPHVSISFWSDDLDHSPNFWCHATNQSTVVNFSGNIFSPTNTPKPRKPNDANDDIILPLRIFAHNYYKLRTYPWELFQVRVIYGW